MNTPAGNDKNQQPGKPQASDPRLVYSDKGEISESDRDREELKPDSANLDLPDVSDIPGQEHVHVLPMGELGDTTAASDDEEGKDLFGDEQA